MKRIYALDNLKAFLILCVLCGHLMEVCVPKGSAHPLYLVIYSFHMPVFLMISGFFGKFRIRQILKLGGLYIVFQLLYKLFVHVFLRSIPIGQISWSFTTPYWLLWYLLVMIYYDCLTPFLEKVSGIGQIFVIVMSCVTALLAGFCPSIGYPLSLSRFFCFLPFFIGGYYLGQHRQKLLALSNCLPSGKRAAALLLGGLCISAAVYLCLNGDFTAKMMYGSYSYSIGYGPWVRLQLYMLAGLWAVGLFTIFLLLLNRKVRLMTFIGQNTLIIYLLHGFLIKFIAYR